MVIGSYILIITLNVNGLNALMKKHRLAGQMKTHAWGTSTYHITLFKPSKCMSLFYFVTLTMFHYGLQLWVKVAQSCPTLFDPMNFTLEFSKPEYSNGYLFLFQGILPNAGIEPRSPALQADSFPAESEGKPCNCSYLLCFCRAIDCKNW